MKKTLLVLTAMAFIQLTAAAQKIPSGVYKPPVTIDGRPKMADLVITNLKVSGKYINSNTEVRDITFEIKNIGTSAPSSVVEMQGYLTNDDVYDWNRMPHACGYSISNATVLLAPGKTLLITFTCRTAIIKPGFKNYVLQADFLNKTIELNENNNHAVALIN